MATWGHGRARPSEVGVGPGVGSVWSLAQKAGLTSRLCPRLPCCVPFGQGEASLPLTFIAGNLGLFIRQTLLRSWLTGDLMTFRRENIFPICVIFAWDWSEYLTQV